MDSDQNHGQYPPPSAMQSTPPYPQFDPPPTEHGAEHSQEIPLEGMRIYESRPPPQATGLNVPTVDVIPPTPSTQSIVSAPQSSHQQTPAELPGHPMEEEQAPPLPQRIPRSEIPDILPPPPPGPPPSKTNSRAFSNTPNATNFPPPPKGKGTTSVTTIHQTQYTTPETLIS